MNQNKNEETDELLQLVSFKMGEEEFGVDILKVQEINRMMEITKVPNAPMFVEGVINLRGRVIPVIDLRVILNMQQVECGNDTRIVVVELNNKTVGFIVDEVNEVLRIPQSITEPPPSMVSGIDSEYITAIGKLDNRLLILLDPDRILRETEVEMLDAV